MKVATIDLETTGTELPIHDAWEVGLVVTEVNPDPGPDEATVESEEVRLWHVQPNLSLAAAGALRVNSYYQRAPLPGLRKSYGGRVQWDDTQQVASEMAVLLDGARLASCNITFDAAFTEKLLRTAGLVPTWHYSPWDIKSMIYGRRRALLGQSTGALLRAYKVDVDMLLAYHLKGHSEHGDEAFGRHTALGDALLANELLFRVLGWGSTYGIVDLPCPGKWGSYRCQLPRDHEDDHWHEDGTTWNDDHTSTKLRGVDGMPSIEPRPTWG